MKKSASVTLQPAAVRRIAGRYPFGHTGDIADADAGIAPGEVVDVKAPGGKVIARGYFNPDGATPLRLLTWEREEVDLKFYRARVKAAVSRREGRILNTDAVRVAYAEADGLPGVVADQFGDVLAVQLGWGWWPARCGARCPNASSSTRMT
jgi:23S rRNA (cytosine1962-C5)-methyltransferase